MNSTEPQRSGYGDPLALLKHCDASTLEKLCDTLTNTSEDTIAYVNFPKRSLVKCFSARDKYEWHLAQTAELESLQRQWQSIEKSRKERSNKSRRKRRVNSKRQDASDRIAACETGGSSSSYSDFDTEGGEASMLQLPTNINSVVHGGISRHRSRRPSPQQSVKSPKSRKSLSPLVVNEDILQEALIVAENFQMSDESDLPSPLSSCQKFRSDSSESEMETNKRSSSATKSLNKTNGTMTDQFEPHRSDSKKLNIDTSMKIPPHAAVMSNTNSRSRFTKQFGKIPPSLTQVNTRVLSSHTNRIPDMGSYGSDNSTMLNSSGGSDQKGRGIRNKIDVGKRGKSITHSIPSTNMVPKHTSTTPRNVKQQTYPSARVSRKQETRAMGAAFRGALSTCLGSKHSSIDMTHSPQKSKTRGISRELSSGPASRGFLKGSFKKSASCGGRPDNSVGSGSFGRLSMPSTTHTSRIWK